MFLVLVRLRALILMLVKTGTTIMYHQVLLVIFGKGQHNCRGNA